MITTRHHFGIKDRLAEHLGSRRCDCGHPDTHHETGSTGLRACVRPDCLCIDFESTYCPDFDTYCTIHDLFNCPYAHNPRRIP